MKVKQLNQLLQSTDVVGNISFSRPTLYIFPACQGDSALFSISGFNLLINGGFSRRACFWDFTRHLGRIDAALMTHLGTDNLYGLSAVLQRKATENIHPEIGFMYLNVSDKLKAVQGEVVGGKEDGNLMVNLAEEGNKMVEYAKQTLGEFPHPCSRSQAGHSVEPINLYHKLGIGSLDMYILNPVTDSKELKDFYQQWNQKVTQFGISQHVPLPNTLSVCALLVWRPSNPNENITRIFFPGNAPQHKIMEGLEKLKTLDILKHAVCSKSSLATKPAPKKPTLGSKPPVARSKISPVQTPKQETAPKKEISKPEPKTAPKPRLASAPKAKKEITNKKTSKETEKSDKAKSSTSSSPSKASTKSATPTTPKSIVSPVQEPEKPLPVKEPEPAPVPVVKEEPKPEAIPEPAPIGGEADLLGLGSAVDPPQLVDFSEPIAPKHEDLEPVISDSPAPLPDPGYQHEPEPVAQPQTLGKDQLLELGVYDEDQDIDQHLNAQPQQPDMFGGMTDSMHGDLQQPEQPTGGFSDLMTTSMHESMYDDREQFGEQPQPQNGLILTPDDEDSEEIMPQALPEPVAYAPASYGQEPDIIPTMPVKEIATPKAETQALVEPDLLPVKQEVEDLDEQSTARIEDELSGANDTYDKHFDDKEMESPDEVSKLPLDKEFPSGTAEVEKHLSEDEGFGQDHLKEDIIEEKDVTEDTEKMLSAPVPEVQKTEQLEEEPEKEMSANDTEECIDDEKIAALPRPPFTHADDIIGSEEGENLPKMSEPAQTTTLSEVMDDEEHECGPKEDLDLDAESQEVAGFGLGKTDAALESPSISPIMDSQKEEIGLESNLHDDFEQIQQEHPQPSIDTLQQQAESVDYSQQEIIYGYDTKALDRESPEMMLESAPKSEELDQKSEEEFESHSHELSESPDMLEHVEQDEVERPKTPEPEDVEAIENIGDKGQDFSHEGTPDSIEEPQEEKDKAFADTDGIVHGLSKEPIDSVGTEEEKENMEPALPQMMAQQPVEDISRDSLEREAMPVPAEFHDDQRDSVERDEEEDDEDDDEEEDSSEEEESQSQSTSYEEEEPSDQKCLIPDSTSEDQKASPESKDIGGGMGAAGHVDSLGVDSQPSDSLLTPESEATDHSYHQMGEQDDVDSSEGMDQMSAMPAQQEYSAPPDFGHAPAEPSGVSTNPFDIDGQPGFNQFMGTQNQPAQPQHGNPFEDSSDDEMAEGGPAKFDPLAEWGQPMGLPSPSPADTKASGATGDKKSPKDKAKANEVKKPEAKKAPGSAGKTKPALPQTAKAPKQSNGVPDKSKRATGTTNPSRLSTGGASNPSRLSTGGASNTLNTSRLSTDRKPAASKARPASAPVKDKTDGKTDTKRPATATGKSSMGTTTKMPPLPPFTPFYVDLTYIPNHGNPQYSDVEFFKRIRARYYVLSALSPNPQVLDALLEAKKTWDDQQSQVTIIPTYDSETLLHWMGLHKELLSDMKVEVAPSASRCTIQLQDQETSSLAYRLEF